MTEADAFLAAIIENPDDDTPRLIYADWLEEHGQSERAEFIRVQCELAKYKSNRCPNRRDHQSPQTLFGYPVIIEGEDCGRCRWCQLRRREKELLVIDNLVRWTPNTSAFRYCSKIRFSRGFVAEITLTCADWLQHRERLLKATPLERVTLTATGLQDQPITLQRGEVASLVFAPDGPQVNLSF